MKNKLLLLSLLSTTLSFSQITVYSTDFATGGDTVRISISNDTGLDFTTTGSNQNWDFSNLTPSSQVLDTFHSTAQIPFMAQIQFGTFAPVKYKASYFREATTLPLSQLTFLPVTINNVFQYTKLSVDSMTSVGYSMVVNGNEIPFKSDTIEKNYEFPIEFGNTTFSRGFTNIDMNPVYDAILRQHRVHASEVDGWGTITTPYGTFNTLRIKHEINELDSVQISLLGTPTWIPLQNPLRRNYEWWSTNEKEPILKISTSEIQGNETVTSVQYRDIYRGLDAEIEEMSRIQISIFPNPVTQELNVNLSSTAESIEIIDIQGKLIKTYSKSNFSEKLDVSSLEKGFYFLKVIDSKGELMQSFEKM